MSTGPVHRFAYNGGRYVYMPAECPGYVGFIVRILDIADPSNPVECGRWWMPEQFKDGMIKGTYPVGHAKEKDWAMCHACTISADPVLVAEFPYSEVPEGFPWPNFNTAGLDGVQGPSGPHNVHEPMGKPWLEDNPNRVSNCYFHAGMRVYDVSDPYYIKKIAYFIPPNPEKLLFDIPIPGLMIATTEDCVVDDRGYIYMDTWHDGMYILRCLV